MPGLEDLSKLLGSDTKKQLTPEKKRGYDGQIMVIKVRTEKRRGKPVTIAWGFQSKPAELAELLALCKRMLGSGGHVTDNALEFQGDHVQRVKELIRSQGYAVQK